MKLITRWLFGKRYRPGDYYKAHRAINWTIGLNLMAGELACRW